MKKIFKFILPFIFLFLAIGCAGYEPIFSAKSIKFEIADYTLQGDKILGNKIFSKLSNASKAKKNEEDVRSVNLFINILKNKEASTKDSTGKILEYKIILNAEIKVTDFITDEQILNQTFISSLSYRVQNQFFDTVKLENKSVEDLINETYQELLIKLSQNIVIK